MIGIVSTARPEDEGTRNDSSVWNPSIVLMKSTFPSPASDPARACRIVSVILPASMTTTMPRATPMISATPSRSRAPLTKVSTNVCSSMRVPGSNLAITKVTIAMPRKSADISPIHHPWLITPQSMITKVRPKSARIISRTRVNSGSGAPTSAPFRKCAMFSSRCAATTERAGSAFTWAAYRMTKRMPAARQAKRMKIRSTSPSVKGTLAAFEAITVANALKVEPSVPMPAPSKMTATPVSAS
jgi:hypothetical protein